MDKWGYDLWKDSVPELRTEEVLTTQAVHSALPATLGSFFANVEPIKRNVYTACTGRSFRDS